MRIAIWVSCLLARAAFADTYLIGDDAHVACYRLADGKSLWDVAPGPLQSTPLLSVHDGKLLVTEHYGKRRYLLDVADGHTLTGAPAEHADAVQPDPAGGLVATHERQFEFAEGYSHSLSWRGPQDRFDLELETFVHELRVVDHIAYFTFADNGNDYGGEVYAFDIDTNRLIWEHDAHKDIHELPDNGYTGIAAERDAVYVAMDQHIERLDGNGKLRWKVALPRQTIRRYDAAWTTMTRVGSRLFARVYETLFALDAATGRVLWSIPGAMASDLWPLVWRDRVCLSLRTAPAEMASSTIMPAGNRTASATALRITRSGTQYRIEPMSRRDIPVGAPVWWSLHPPPDIDPRPPLHLRLEVGEGVERWGVKSTVQLDLSSVLSKDGVAYVKLTYFYRYAALWQDTSLLAAIDIRPR